MNNNKKTKKKRHNGEGSIRQKPNGRYEVRISGRDMETGKSTRISKYADTLDEAVDIQHALSVAMVQTPQYLQNNTTVGEWLDNWLTTYMQHTLKQSTYKSYETYVRKHFKPSLGTIKLKELTPRTLQIFYNYKQEQEKLSPKTISNLNMCLHKALAASESTNGTASRRTATRAATEKSCRSSSSLRAASYCRKFSTPPSKHWR